MQQIFLAEPTLEAPVDTALNRAWRDSLASSMWLDPEWFQVALGAAHMRPDEPGGLNRYADLSPPRGPAAWLGGPAGPGQWSAYLAMLRSLLPAAETGLRGCLGPHYPAWIARRNAADPDTPQAQLFAEWVWSRLPARTARRAIALFEAGRADPLAQAIDACCAPERRLSRVKASGHIETQPICSATPLAARGVLSNAPAANLAFCFTPQTAPTGVPQRFFGAHRRQDGSRCETLRALDRKALSAPISVNGLLTHTAALPIRPGGWCDDFVTYRAYMAGDDPSVWDTAAKSGGWRAFFGPNGRLARRIGHVVLAGGCSLTLTSHACYAPAEVAWLRRSARWGVWPFLAAEGCAATMVRFSHRPDSTLEIAMTMPAHRLQILGGVLRDARY